MSDDYLFSLNMGELIKKAKAAAKEPAENREDSESSSTETHPELEYLEDQADEVLKNKLGNIDKLYEQTKDIPEKIQKLIKHMEENEKNPNRVGQDEKNAQIYLESLLQMSAKTALSLMADETKVRVEEAEAEAKRGQKKPEVRYFAQGASWRPPEDWELHHQYILEVFNPQTTVYSTAKPKEALEPGETLEIDPVEEYGPKPQGILGIGAQVIFQLSKVSKWVLWGEWPATAYRTVRRSEQAPKLDTIPVSDVPKNDKTSKNPTVPDDLRFNLVLKKVIHLMASHVYGEARGALQSDQIIELYDRAQKAKHHNYRSIFFYPYTDAERRSPLFHKTIQGNEPEPRVVSAVAGAALGTFTGQVAGNLINASVRFGLELYPAVVFLVPEKCQTSSIL